MEESTPPELKQFPPGRIVADRYEVIETLGWGGMGLVLKAKDKVLNDEVVALKVLYQRFGADEGVFARFKREVILTRRLAHPNIVRVYDFGDAGDDTYFISMEYVEGETLDKKLDAGTLTFPEILRYLHQIGLGLAYAHSQSVVHRDLKPSNMMVTADGVLKITDFGVARSVVSDEKLTRTDEAVGSPVYMSPEQLKSVTIDHRSDIYCLGIMAYELVIGDPPFYSDHWVALARMHLTEPVPRITKKDVPSWFQFLIDKATAKDPDERFQTGKDFNDFIAAHSDVNGARPSNGLVIDAAQILAVMVLVLLVLACGYALW